MRGLQHFSPPGSTSREGKQDSELFAGREDPSSPYTWIVPPAGDSSGKAGSLKSINNEMGVAKWWVPPTKGVLQDTYVRHLEGEIHLESDLQPSSSCPLFLVEVGVNTLIFLPRVGRMLIFDLQYSVEMLPFVSDGFEPDQNTWGDPRLRVISSSRVEIGTAYALDGPKPVPFTEPPTTAPTAAQIAAPSSFASGSGTSNSVSEGD